MKALAISIAVFAAAAGEKARAASAVEPTGDAPVIKVESRHAPLKVMGRDYWTMLASNRFSDPARDATLVGFWDVPEIRRLPVFRDCGLVAFANSLRRLGGVSELIEGKRMPTSGDSFEADVPAGDIRVFSL